MASDNTSGAQHIAREALALFHDYCVQESSSRGFAIGLVSLTGSISRIQTQMSGLANVCRLVAAAANRGAASAREYVEQLRSKVEESPGLAANRAAELITSGKKYITISQSEFILRTFKAAADAGKLVQVYVMESRPLFEGRETARALGRMGHSPVLVADAAAGRFIGEVDSAFVGADALLGDGTVVNKIGSYPLALLCAHRKKNFYVVTSVLRCDNSRNATTFLNKEVPGHEILADKEIEVKNLYYDIVEPGLITAVVTEAGTYSPAAVKDEIVAAMKRIYG